MRKFYLTDKTGQRYALQDTQVFFYAPTGLGFSALNTTYSLGNGFYSTVFEDVVQPSIQGSLVFSGDPYAGYNAFLRWISKAEDLTLVYVPDPSLSELYMRVQIEMIEKGELSVGGQVLLCPLVLRGLTPYYKQNPISFELSESTGNNSMRFTFTFPFTFSRLGQNNSASFVVGGHYPASLKLETVGALSNPIARVTEIATGQTIGIFSLRDISITAEENLIYSSFPSQSGVWLKSNEGYQSIIDSLDLSLDNFFSIPPNTEYKISFSADVPVGATNPIVYVTIYEFYKG